MWPKQSSPDKIEIGAVLDDMLHGHDLVLTEMAYWGHVWLVRVHKIAMAEPTVASSQTSEDNFSSAVALDLWQKGLSVLLDFSKFLIGGVPCRRPFISDY